MGRFSFVPPCSQGLSQTRTWNLLRDLPWARLSSAGCKSQGTAPEGAQDGCNPGN